MSFTPASGVAPRSHNSLDEPWPAGTPIRLCAIRVEFQPDNVSGTTGDGTVGSGFPDTLLIDPLPHDKQYFEDHLAFLENYYTTVSKNAITFISLDIFPTDPDSIYRLEQPMWHYNFNTDPELLDEKLVEFFADAVNAAGDVNWSNYDAILIFHAGVGKDFNVGFDLTPFDIPSAYISENDLQESGVSVPAGVTRGLILPEGQNQAEVLEFDIELSLNGVMVKLFGNWLGLPDLFDTETGQSGIGRWGMMDQGSGNVNALVPAMPEAWSRMYMGWQRAVDVVPSGEGDTLGIGIFSTENVPEILRVPVTPTEYYLIENRSDRADTLTVNEDGDTITYTTLYDRDNRRLFASPNGDFIVDSGFQVAVRASNYDFGIPGSGLLIWHIDETVIEGNLETNSVNNDPEHRGVDLVEADGPQDIGKEFGFATAGSGTELGIPDDAWYRENRSHAEANGGTLVVRFTDRSQPSARLYDDAFTYLEFTDFSSIDSIMSFRLRSTITESGFPVALGADADWVPADLNLDGLHELYFVTDSTLGVVDTAGNYEFITNVPQGLSFVKTGSHTRIHSAGIDHVLLEGSHIGILSWQDSTYQLGLTAESGGDVRVFPALNADSTGRLLAVRETTIFLFDYSLNLLDQVTYESDFDDLAVFNLSSYPSNDFLIEPFGEAICIAIEDTSFIERWRKTDVETGKALVLNSPNQRSVYIGRYGYVDVTTGELLCPYPDCIEPTVDWNQDGIPGGGGLSGQIDIVEEDFPALSADIQKFIDLDINRTPDILAFDSAFNDTLYTRITVVKHIGGLFTGFPFATSGIEDQEPFLWDTTRFLHVVSETIADMSLPGTGNQYFYSIVRIPVQTANTNEPRFAFHEPESIINVGALRPLVHARQDWLYCWPNPTTDVSYIRITKPYAANANATLFDLAGRKVAELNGSSDIAGPFEMQWNVSNIASGVYIAQVSVTGGGITESSQVKIAVVK